MAQLPAQTLGFIASKIRSEGYGAAAGDMFGPALLAFATDGMLGKTVGPTLDAQEAADINTLLFADKINQQIARDRELIKSAKDWGSMSSEDMYSLAQARKRLEVLSPQTIDREVMERLGNSKSAFDQQIYNELRDRYGSHIFTQADIERLARSKDPYDRELAEAYRKTGKKWNPKDIHRENPLPHAGEYAASNSEWIGRALRYGVNGMRHFNRVLGSVPAQVFYLTAAAFASEANPDLWEKTRFGKVVAILLTL